MSCSPLTLSPAAYVELPGKLSYTAFLKSDEFRRHTLAGRICRRVLKLWHRHTHCPPLYADLIEPSLYRDLRASYLKRWADYQLTLAVDPAPNLVDRILRESELLDRVLATLHRRVGVAPR